MGASMTSCSLAMTETQDILNKTHCVDVMVANRRVKL